MPFGLHRDGHSDINIHSGIKNRLKALLSNVPDDKMIIIDLGNDYPKWVCGTPNKHGKHDGFYGKKWIFSYVPNFGGKNTMVGDLDMYASSSVKALRAQIKVT